MHISFLCVSEMDSKDSRFSFFHNHESNTFMDEEERIEKEEENLRKHHHHYTVLSYVSFSRVYHPLSFSFIYQYQQGFTLLSVIHQKKIFRQRKMLETFQPNNMYAHDRIIKLVVCPLLFVLGFKKEGSYNNCFFPPHHYYHHHFC